MFVLKFLNGADKLERRKKRNASIKDVAKRANKRLMPKLIDFDHQL